MQASDDRHFVGAMFPEIFLDTFMKVANLPAAPAASYAGVPDGGSVREVCRRLIHAVEKFKVCPGLRLFAARTTRQRAKQEMPRVQQETTRDSNEEVPQETQENWPYPCPAMAARTQPKSRRKTKRRDLVEYYDFSTVVLDVEVDCRPEADPFVDPPESTASRATSAAPSPLRSSPRPEPSSNSPPLPSHHPRAPGGHAQAPSIPLQRGSSPSNFPSECAGGVKSVGLEPVGGPVPPPLYSPTAEAGPSKARRDGSPASAVSTYEPFPNPSKEGAAFRKSMVSHASAVFARQHRTFLFQLVIVDRWARFVRWDRSGAVGSERFDYVWEPQVLAEFFWRFAHMTGEERGFDSSAKLASKQEAALFNAAVREFLDDMKAGMKDGKPARRLPNAERTLDDTGTYPTWKVRVVDAVTRKGTDLVVGRPFSGPSGMFGRCTRAYIAYGLTERRLVFLKDTWRLENPCLRAESKTYRELRRHGVSHVPAMLFGGDVQNVNKSPQQTVAQVHAADEDPWRITGGHFDSFVHHRIVQDIAYPLESVLHDREFVQVIHNVSSAIADAYHKAGLLHRDISLGNIMVTSQGEGVLNDWDHAGRKDEPVLGIGTCAFMSVSLLIDHRHIHSIADDLESLYWIFVYEALKYFAEPPESEMVRRLFVGHFAGRKGRQARGITKRTFIGTRFLSTTEFRSSLVQTLACELNTCWWKYYLAKDDPDFLAEGTEARESVFRMLELAAEPTFWTEMFDTALQKHAYQPTPPVYPQRDPSVSVSQHPSHSSPECSTQRSVNSGVITDANTAPRAGRKRKASAQLEAEAAAFDTATQGPRRSKRLRRVPT